MNADYGDGFWKYQVGVFNNSERVFLLRDGVARASPSEGALPAGKPALQQAFEGAGDYSPAVKEMKAAMPVRSVLPPTLERSREDHVPRAPIPSIPAS